MLTHSNEVGSGLDVALEITRKVPQTVPDAGKIIYTALVATAVETAHRRQYSVKTSTVTFHCPLEQVALAVGLSRQSLWRHLPALKELGLVDYRTHKGAFFGNTFNTGTLFQVKLNPGTGKRANLTNEELRHKWRNMEEDYRRYRMSSLTLKRHVVTYKKTSPNIDLILQWAAPFPPSTNRTPGKIVCNRVLEAVLDTVSAPKEDRNNIIELASEALSSALNDSGSTNWYQKLLWQLLRRYDATGEDYSYQVYLAAVRAAVDSREGFARKPGALLISRLKQADWFDEVMRQPPCRVGTKPLRS